MIREVHIFSIDRIRYTDCQIGDAMQPMLITLIPQESLQLPPWIHPRCRELN